MSSLEFSFSFEEKEENYTFIGRIGNHSRPSFNEESKFTSFVFSNQLSRSIEKKSPKKNYSEGIVTLRLHENFIKIIEDSEESVNDQEAMKSNHTNQELLLNDKIGKKDEETIF